VHRRLMLCETEYLIFAGKRAVMYKISNFLVVNIKSPNKSRVTTGTIKIINN